MADLITRQELLDFENKIEADLEPQEVRKYDDAIRDASAAIRAYTDRDFALNASGVATTRTYEYDPSGYVDIDDAQSVTGVTINYSYGSYTQSLTTGQWQAQPFQGPIKDTVYIYSRLGTGMSREMGFTWNLDRYDPGPTGPPTVDVTGVWGWAAIPDDVQRATVWTASAFAEQTPAVTSEGIEGFNRSMRIGEPSAIPLRARELLDEYRRLTV